MPDYASAAYWDERYAADETATFDWYQTYDSLKPYLAPYLQDDDDFEIYIPGCGNSSALMRCSSTGGYVVSLHSVPWLVMAMQLSAHGCTKTGT